MAPYNTLLYTRCDDPNDEHYADFNALEQELKALRTAEGRPYKLLPLPLPDPIFEVDGHRLPATYANFLVINGAVLCPTYGLPDLDNEALSIIGEAFPKWEIIGIDCSPVIWQHGSLHCCTMQFPRMEK
jgi:agmatine/peptidylarginine deiminase